MQIVLINILVLQLGPSNKNFSLRLISPHFYVEIVYVSHFIVYTLVAMLIHYVFEFWSDKIELNKFKKKKKLIKDEESLVKKK